MRELWQMIGPYGPSALIVIACMIWQNWIIATAPPPPADQERITELERELGIGQDG